MRAKAYHGIGQQGGGAFSYYNRPACCYLYNSFSTRFTNIPKMTHIKIVEARNIRKNPSGKFQMSNLPVQQA